MKEKNINLFYSSSNKIADDKNENKFTRLMEFRNKIVKIKVDLFPNDYSGIDAIIFIFNVLSRDSFEYSINQIKRYYLSKGIPYILVANYSEKRYEKCLKSGIIGYDELEKSASELDCDLFEKKSNCYEDNDYIFYLILKKIEKLNTKTKMKKKKKNRSVKIEKKSAKS